jgi:hypothetical protein
MLPRIVHRRRQDSDRVSEGDASAENSRGKGAVFHPGEARPCPRTAAGGLATAFCRHRNRFPRHELKRFCGRATNWRIDCKAQGPSLDGKGRRRAWGILCHRWLNAGGGCQRRRRGIPLVAMAGVLDRPAWCCACPWGVLRTCLRLPAASASLSCQSRVKAVFRIFNEITREDHASG